MNHRRNVPISRMAVRHPGVVSADDGEPFLMTIDACFTAVRAGAPSDVKVFVAGLVHHGTVRSGDELTVVHGGKEIRARCVGVTMSTPIAVELSGIEKFDPVSGDYMYVAVA